MLMDSTTLTPQFWPELDLDLDWDNLFTEPDVIESREEGERTQINSPPDFDWDNLFIEPDEIESRELGGGSSSTQIIPPPHFHNLDNAAAKKRKRNQSIVFSEKIRRKRMRQFLSTITSILPIPNTKVARYCLIEETIKYIQKLQQQVQDLKKKREQLLGKKNWQELSSPSPSLPPSTVIVNVDVEVMYGDEVFIRITSLKMPSNLWKVYQVFEAQDLEIQSADVYTGDSIVLLSFRANCTTDGSCTQLNMEQTKHSLQTDLIKAYG